MTKMLVTNLNKIIDVNFYVNEKTKKSNMENRPIAIGVQGFADMLIKMRITYEQA